MCFRLALLFGLCAFAQDVDGPAILRPTNGTAVSAGPLSIVARGGATANLTLDGAPVAVGRPGVNAITATIELAAGVHELTLGKQTVKFAAVAKDAAVPEGFKKFRPHPESASCGTCHNAKAWDVKETVTNCFTCHDTSTFPKKHDHTPEVMKDCGWCHNTHGSGEAAHLKMPREKACKLCHP